MTAPKLEPCPFCRGEAMTFGKGMYFCVKCPKCRATVGWVLGPGETPEDVITAWNTRADLIDMDLLRRVDAALAVYADGCDATETTHCGYEGNQCCKTAKDILTDLRAWMEKINE